MKHLVERMNNPLRSLIYCRYIASFIGKYAEVDHCRKEIIEQYISSKSLFREMQSAVVMWRETPAR